MMIEQDGRKLLLIEDDAEWDKFPKEFRALPVYYRRTKTGIDLWPMWPDHVAYPTIRIEP